MNETKIEGLDELLKKFRKLPADLRNNHNAASNPVNKALMSAALPVKKTAKALAPKDSGNLERNIISTRMKKKQERFEVGVMVRTQGKAGDPRNAYYWFFHEFGTSEIPARPFMRPAFESQREKALGIFVKRLAKTIAQAAEKK